MPTLLHAGAPGQRQNVSLLGWVRGDVRLVLSCAVMLMYVLQMIRRYFFTPAKQWDFWLLGVLLFVLLYERVTRFWGGWESGELRLLGAFLPKPAPQKRRGVPWAPSPLCFSF